MLSSKVAIFALILFEVATASKFITNDDFWPPFQVFENRLNKNIFSKCTCFNQEQWRCLHTKNTYNYILDTHQRINFFENPKGKVAIDFDCPIIDPNNPQWCPSDSNGEYYPVKCNLFISF